MKRVTSILETKISKGKVWLPRVAMFSSSILSVTSITYLLSDCLSTDDDEFLFSLLILFEINTINYKYKINNYYY